MQAQKRARKAARRAASYGADGYGYGGGAFVGGGYGGGAFVGGGYAGGGAVVLDGYGNPVFVQGNGKRKLRRKRRAAGGAPIIYQGYNSGNMIHYGPIVTKGGAY